MWPNLREDFRRAYAQTTYRGALRKWLFTLTAPGFQAVCGYRFARWLYQRHIPLVGAIVQRLLEVWTGISIPPETQIGPGLLVLHFGGIVINGRAVLGRDCTLHHGVTIGNRVAGGASPTLGNRVMLGAGAKVLGGVTLADDVDVGANAVVLASLPAGAVAAGVPANVVRIKTSGSTAA